MKKLLIAALCVVFAAPAMAQDREIGARQGLMKLIVVNFGPLGAMAKGEAEYDAAKAQSLADNLLALSSVNPMNLFPEGSDNGALGDKTKALPAIWANTSDFESKWNAMGDAVDNLAASAAGGLDAMKAAFGGTGKACGGCHETYRQKNN